MKRFLPLTLLALIACSKDDPERVYTDVLGSWEFKADDIAGNFSAIKSETSNIYGNLYIDNAKGSFTIKGTTKPIIKTQLYIVGFSVNQLVLREKDNGGDYIEFYYSGNLRSDYESMTFDEYRIQQGSNYEVVSLTTPLVIKRTK